MKIIACFMFIRVHLGPGSCCGFMCYTRQLPACLRVVVCAGNWRESAERYEKCVFLTTVGLVRPKTRDKWLKVSHDAGSALIHDVI